MTVVNKLSVVHVRSHDTYVVQLSPTTTVITGENGSGKTSLLEAIYISLQGTSFKGSDNDILRFDTDWWRIDITFDDGSKRIVSFDPNLTSGKKKFVIDEKTNYRLLQKYKYPVVLFEPDDLRLLHGSPTRRRQFIDRFVSQLDPLYATNLHKYDRALKQRNNLLKQAATNSDDLFVWNIALSEYGSYIIDKRIGFIEQINTQINDAYAEIAGIKDSVSVHYSHTSIGDTKQKLLNELHTTSQKDTYLGFTSVGPHRHDVIFKLNNSPAMSVASRGEVRSIVLALKFLEVDIIEKITDKKPIILLDDVFSELDLIRQKKLSDTIRSHQIIITTTHIEPNSKQFKHITLT